MEQPETEHRSLEAEKAATYRPTDYEDEFTPEQVARRKHRRRVGGLWDEMGELQLRFLRSQGMRPEHRLLDVACGALRGGVKFVDYLEPGHYFGLDINESLVEAGYQHELSAQQRERLPRANLRATDRFECDFGVAFDYAMAQSLFTHVSLNHIRLCLYRVGQAMAPGGRFFATYFGAAGTHPVDGVLPAKKGLWTERNPYFYYRSDLRWAARCTGWQVRFVGDWGHPRGQLMAEFRRPTGAQRLVREGMRPGALRGTARRVPGVEAAYRALRR
jgi:SAM-dependent methyltransferase